MNKIIIGAVALTTVAGATFAAAAPMDSFPYQADPACAFSNTKGQQKP